jgi:enamine deaminase RidA (YjgF/YER057c/UK114 family)
MRIHGLFAGVAMIVMAGAGAAQLAPVRMGPPQSPIAASVGVPAGSNIVYVSGTVPDAINEKAPAGSVERFGDTAAQTRSILGKIEKVLAQQGMGLGDVVMMRVFLVAPPGESAMDFAGMMKAYSERFGTAAQPNKPARSTMEVAGLVDPGWLVEIEVTAAGGQKQPN